MLNFGRENTGLVAKWWRNIDKEIFLRNKRTVGPVLLGGEICVLRVLNIYKKGSYRGLEEVFDEVYQRIYKAQVSKNRLLLLDSLKKTMNIPPQAKTLLR